MAEKTEAPTGRRLHEARAEGQVAISRELNTAAALLVGTWLLLGTGEDFISSLQSLMIDMMTFTPLPDADPNSLWLFDLLRDLALRLLPSLGIIVLGLLVTGVSITIFQTGFLWASKRLQPDLSRLNPINGLKRLFSLQGLVELIKAILKLAIVGLVVYSFLKGRMLELFSMAQTDFKSALNIWVGLASSLALRVGVAYLVLAIADYGYQRWQHKESLKMRC